MQFISIFLAALIPQAMAIGDNSTMIASQANYEAAVKSGDQQRIKSTLAEYTAARVVYFAPEGTNERVARAQGQYAAATIDGNPGRLAAAAEELRLAQVAAGVPQITDINSFPGASLTTTSVSGPKPTGTTNNNGASSSPTPKSSADELRAMSLAATAGLIALGLLLV
ncbi:hypothetical protein BC833DRAFT_569280 [Globomyces pollinis-pini]|nr:hypothetical protein BC833DRAFT_569280 [Globomyces pollinis-pini]